VIKNEVKLDDPVQQYLPETLLVPQRGGQLITLEELATHTSGLPKMPPNFLKGMDFATGNPFAKFNDGLLAEGLKAVKYKDEKEKPKFMYSNIGVGLLGYGLARRFGKSYEELMQERIIVPSKMATTSTTTKPADRKRLISGYTLFDQPGKDWQEMHDNLAGCGLLRSTAADLLTYLEFQMGRKETPLRAAMDLSQQPRLDVAGKVSIGLGWLSMKSDDRPRIWWHDGATGSYCTFVGFCKEPGVGFVLLSNRSTPFDTGKIGMEMMRVLVDGKKP
jgi:serine-type D-Ala-D-Ala carboxypeptidase/endopeptidase